MRICNRCRAAENPRGTLRFRESPEGVLCDNCYSVHYSVISDEKTSAASDYAVIVCPDCRGKHHASHGAKCKACLGYGSVRIAVNSLPVYVVGGSRVLTEESCSPSTPHANAQNAGADKS